MITYYLLNLFITIAAIRVLKLHIIKAYMVESVYHQLAGSKQNATEKVKVIQQWLETAQSRHKSFADIRRRGIEFSIRDWVFLKVSSMKGVVRFRKKGKLIPRYIGPYKIIWKFSQVAYYLSYHKSFHQFIRYFISQCYENA